jgi:transmembrane protein
MSNEPETQQPERCPISSIVMDGLILYGCSMYPTAASIEMMAQMHGRNFRPASRQGQRRISEDERQRPPGMATQQGSKMMNRVVNELLEYPAVTLLARVMLTFPFWESGLSKLIDFDAGVAEMAHFGLAPPALFAVATILVQLGGSLLIVLNRLAWLGAGALGCFTALTIFLVHHFWTMTEEPFRTIAFHTATEHVGMIGGLVAISILAARRREKAH